MGASNRPPSHEVTEALRAAGETASACVADAAAAVTREAAAVVDASEALARVVRRTSHQAMVAVRPPSKRPPPPPCEALPAAPTDPDEIEDNAHADSDITNRFRPLR